MVVEKRIEIIVRWMWRKIMKIMMGVMEMNEWNCRRMRIPNESLDRWLIKMKMMVFTE